MTGRRSQLVEAFVARLPTALQPVYSAMPNLDELLGDMVASALAAWPQISVSAPEFLEFVAGRISPDQSPDEALGGLFVADLFLACGCARRDRRALEAFERDFAGEIARGVSAMAGDALRGDDFKQEVRNKLFVGKAPAGPKIAEYSGRGSLRRWVRITARRTYLDMMRAERRDPEILVGDDIVSERASEADPELAFVKEKYQQEFRTAFTAALGTLSTRQRNLLRHHFVHRLRFDEIAGIYRVHRATVARWIADARASLLEQTRSILRGQIAVGASELDSIMRLVSVDLDLTVSRLLKRQSV